MRKQFFFLFSVLAAAVSCSKENPAPVSTAGNVNADNVEGVGQYMRFWSATAVETPSDNAYARGISYNSDGFFVNGSNNNYKYCGRSVRCLKN